MLCCAPSHVHRCPTACWAANAAFVKAELMNKSGNGVSTCQDSVTTWRLLCTLHATAVCSMPILLCRCGRMPGVCGLSMSPSVSQQSGLIPLHLSPWIPAVRTPLHRWVASSPSVRAEIAASQCYYQSVTRLSWWCTFQTLTSARKTCAQLTRSVVTRMEDTSVSTAALLVWPKQRPEPVWVSVHNIDRVFHSFIYLKGCEWKHSLQS